MRVKAEQGHSVPHQKTPSTDCQSDGRAVSLLPCPILDPKPRSATQGFAGRGRGRSRRQICGTWRGRGDLCLSCFSLSDPPCLCFSACIWIARILRVWVILSVTGVIIQWLYRLHKWECLVTKLRPTLCNPMDCSLRGSSVHGILQARILKWVAISSSRGPSQPRDPTWVSWIAGGFFTNWATREAQYSTRSFQFLRNFLPTRHWAFSLSKKSYKWIQSNQGCVCVCVCVCVSTSVSVITDSPYV